MSEPTDEVRIAAVEATMNAVVWLVTVYMLVAVAALIVAVTS